MSNWLNMDTAPKDGTKVDLWAKFWQAHRDDFIYQRFTDCYWTQGDSMTSRDSRWVGISKEWCPIAWMPLPEPPDRIPKPQNELPTPEDLRGLYK